MPQDPPVAKDTLTASDFQMQANPDSIAGLQANESFMLKASKDQVLGQGGETVAFAKYQYSVDENAMAQLQAEYNAAMDVYGDDPENPVAVKAYQEAKAKFEAPQNVAVTSAALFEEKKAMEGNLQLGGDRGLLARAVASKELDKVVGINVIAEEKFGVDAAGKPIGVSVQCDGQGLTSRYEGKDTFLAVDLKDPAIQRGLSDLEAVDYLSGQIDRHAGNIFVDPTTKQVTGIDNDLAFPEVDREAMLQNSALAQQKAVVGMPRMMHQETADKILATKPEDLRQALETMECPDGVGRMSQKAIDGAVGRLEALQTELKKEDSSIKVVTQFDEHTYQEAVDAQAQTLKVQLGDDASLSTLDSSQCPFAVGAEKTSYVAAMAIQERRYELGATEQPDDFGIRPLDSVGQAQRSPGYPTPNDPGFKAFQQMGPEDKQQFVAKSLEVAALQKKADDYQSRIDKLDQGSATTKFKALFKGGVGSERKELLNKAAECLTQAKAGEQTIAGLIDKHTPAEPQNKVESKANKESVRQKLRGFREDKQSDGPKVDAKSNAKEQDGPGKTRERLKRQPIQKSDTSSSTIRH